MWTCWGITASVAALIGLGVMLLDIADEARTAEKKRRKASTPTSLEKP